MQGIFFFQGCVLRSPKCHGIDTTEPRNVARITTTVHYDWSLLKNRDIRDEYMLTLRNKFDALQKILKTPTLNDEYENFINAHLEAAAECIPTKLRTKSRVPWETLVVRKKCADIKCTSKCNRRNPTNINGLKLKKAQNELANCYSTYLTDYNELFLLLWIPGEYSSWY